MIKHLNPIHSALKAGAFYFSYKDVLCIAKLYSGLIDTIGNYWTANMDDVALIGITKLLACFMNQKQFHDIKRWFWKKHY